MRRLLPFSPMSLLVWLAFIPACNVANTSHCGNLEGNATCSQRAASTPYCNICIADNDGCAAEAPAEASCLATTAAATSTSMATTSSSTVEPTTSTSLVPTSTGYTSIGDTSTGDTSTSTGDTSTSTSTSTGDTSTSTSTTDASGTSGTTMVGPMCGNDMVEGDEVCDGKDLDDKNCTTIAQSKYGGGTLKCTKSCESFDDTACCLGVGVGVGCNNILGPKCCGGLYCFLGTCKVE